MAAETLPIQIRSSSGVLTSGSLSVERWTPAQRRGRALKFVSRIFIRFLLVCTFAIFVHPLIIPTIIALILSPVILTYLYSYRAGQEATFLFAEGKCPNCEQDGKLNPYLWNTLADEMSVICPGCGQTCQVILPAS